MIAMQRHIGVTMIELLVVIAIAAILAAITGPSFSSFITNTRMTSTVSQLSGDLNLARSEAIKRNSWIMVCVSNAAATDCGTGTNWQAGWLVCADADQNWSCDASTATSPNPILIRPSLRSGYTLTGSAASFRFNPNGTGGPGTLSLVSGTNSRTARISVTGNVSVTTP